MAANYTGRFAPSPSGSLHFGSLLAALASFLDARAHDGRWLLRIEDLDPPREQAGADQWIQQTLAAHGLLWDGEPIYQSRRHAAYDEALTQLSTQGLSYRCNCTRQRLHGLGQCYDRHCYHHPPPADQPAALRFRAPDEMVVFDDRVLGEQRQNLCVEGDGIVRRKDGLYAYMLAVVVDDHLDGINAVVRGADILPATGRQLALWQALGSSPPPTYAHIPLALAEDGRKLSKQNGAPALDNTRPASNLYQALAALQQAPPPELAKLNVAEVLDWAVTHWSLVPLRP